MNRALLAALIALPACASAQTLLSMTASNPRPLPGEPVEFTVDLKGDGNNWCGLIAFFGDGERSEIRVDAVPVRLTKRYQAPGNYAVRVEGAFVRRGLRSALACQGAAQTVLIDVVDAAKEEQARRAEQKARELAQRERDLELRERVAQANRDRADAVAAAASKAHRDKPAPAADAASPSARHRDDSLKVFQH
jgi:hypothetical protein